MNVIKKKFESLIYLMREKYKSKKRKRLKNTTFSLIASNCNGGVILHDLGLRFNTPFINLSIPPKDFIKLVGDFRFYMALELVEQKDDSVNYPVGNLGGLRIDFMHYATFADAKSKWDERKQRINYDDLYYMLTEREGCSLDDLKQFDALPLEHKVVFTHRKYPTIQSSFYLPGFKKQGEVRLSMHYPKPYSIKRYVDKFDFVNWVNGESI